VYGGLHSPGVLPSTAALLELGREFTPRVEAPSPTPVLLDLHGLGRGWPTPESLGQALLETACRRALVVHVALAFTRVAALVLARAREGLTVVPAGEEAAALAPLPLALLDLDPDRADLFRRWGLRTFGDLAALPLTGLAERLGEGGPSLVRLARGEDSVPLVATPLPAAFEMTLDLDWPVDGLEPLSFLLAAVDLALRLVDGSVHRRSLRPALPSGDPRTWRTLLILDLETHPPHDAIQTITVSAEPTPSRVVQFSLLDPAQPSPERLAETMARLAAWTDAGRAGAPALLDTHRPGAFAVGTFAPGPFVPHAASPPAPRAALRVFRPPLPADVTLRAGSPAFVSAVGVRGSVTECAGPWRASGDWWDVAWSREEWDVALATGVYRIFRDRLREAWFVEGELD